MIAKIRMLVEGEWREQSNKTRREVFEWARLEALTRAYEVVDSIACWRGYRQRQQVVWYYNRIARAATRGDARALFKTEYTTIAATRRRVAEIKKEIEEAIVALYCDLECIDRREVAAVVDAKLAALADDAAYE